MSFAGLSKASDRADVLAYVHSMADSPIPLPTADAASPSGETPAPAQGTGEPATTKKPEAAQP
jgi:cytochrome c